MPVFVRSIVTENEREEEKKEVLKKCNCIHIIYTDKKPTFNQKTIARGFMASMSLKLAKIFLSEALLRMYTDILDLIDYNFGDIEASKIDMLLGLVLLNTYYQNHRPFTNKFIRNPEFLQQGHRFMLFAAGN